MKIILKYILVFVGFGASAQPAFTHNHCFKVGDSTRASTAYVLETFESQVAKTGTNYTWDYSSYAWATPSGKYKFQAGNSSIHTGFENSQINEYLLASFSRDLAYSYSIDFDTLYMEAVYSVSSYFYKPSVPYLSFPLNFNDSVKVHRYQYAHPSFPTTPTGSIHRKWTYDGFGSLKLPDGNNANVYRIRTNQVDSTLITSTANVYDELIWFRQSDGIPILRMVKQGPVCAVYFCTSETTGIGTNKEPSAVLHLYPNPAKNYVQLEVGSMKLEENKNDFQFSIFNNLGVKLLDGISNNNEIEISGLLPGMYILKTEFGVGRFVKEN